MVQNWVDAPESTFTKTSAWPSRSASAEPAMVGAAVLPGRTGPPVWVVEAEVAHPASTAATIPPVTTRSALDITRVLPHRDGLTIPYTRQPSARLRKSPRKQVCTVVNGSGVIGDADVSNIEVHCQ
jgi:hypothetical protein